MFGDFGLTCAGTQTFQLPQKDASPTPAEHARSEHEHPTKDHDVHTRARALAVDCHRRPSNDHIDGLHADAEVLKEISYQRDTSRGT